MTIQCVACRRHIQVPDERAGNPRLKIKCSCGSIFMLQEAPIASGPPPAPDPAPAEAAPSPVSFQATAALGERPGAAEARPPRPGSSWRRCVNHSGARSESMCRTCGQGYCRECEHKVQNAVMCQKCETLCIPTVEHEARLARDRQRAQPMMDELNTILTYPLHDVTGFVSLAVFTGIFGLMGKVAIIYGKAAALLFSQGVLMAYCFTALSRVSSGNLKDFMPDIGEIGDLVRAIRLGLAALLASSGPLLLIIFLVPGLGLFGGMSSETESPPPPPTSASVVSSTAAGDLPVVDVSSAATEGSLGPGIAFVLLAVLALVWKIAYTPMALTVAGLSRSFWSTLNPSIGIDTIRRMGAVYWHAMGIYTVIALAQWFLSAILSFIPVLGLIVRPFVDAYAYLMIGCTLGIAVFKKAVELGLE